MQTRTKWMIGAGAAVVVLALYFWFKRRPSIGPDDPGVMGYGGGGGGFGGATGGGGGGGDWFDDGYGYGYTDGALSSKADEMDQLEPVDENLGVPKLGDANTLTLSDGLDLLFGDTGGGGGGGSDVLGGGAGVDLLISDPGGGSKDTGDLSGSSKSGGSMDTGTGTSGTSTGSKLGSFFKAPSSTPRTSSTSTLTRSTGTAPLTRITSGLKAIANAVTSSPSSSSSTSSASSASKMSTLGPAPDPVERTAPASSIAQRVAESLRAVGSAPTLKAAAAAVTRTMAPTTTKVADVAPVTAGIAPLVKVGPNGQRSRVVQPVKIAASASPAANTTERTGAVTSIARAATQAAAKSATPTSDAKQAEPVKLVGFKRMFAGNLKKV